MWSVIMGYLALFMLTPMLSNYVIELSRNPGEIAIKWDAKCFPIAHKKGEKQNKYKVRYRVAYRLQKVGQKVGI